MGIRKSLEKRGAARRSRTLRNALAGIVSLVTATAITCAGISTPDASAQQSLDELAMAPAELALDAPAGEGLLEEAAAGEAIDGAKATTPVADAEELPTVDAASPDTPGDDGATSQTAPEAAPSSGVDDLSAAPNAPGQVAQDVPTIGADAGQSAASMRGDTSLQQPEGPLGTPLANPAEAAGTTQVAGDDALVGEGAPADPGATIATTEETGGHEMAGGLGGREGADAIGSNAEQTAAQSNDATSQAMKPFAYAHVLESGLIQVVVAPESPSPMAIEVTAREGMTFSSQALESTLQGFDFNTRIVTWEDGSVHEVLRVRVEAGSSFAFAGLHSPCVAQIEAVTEDGARYEVNLSEIVANARVASGEAPLDTVDLLLMDASLRASSDQPESGNGSDATIEFANGGSATLHADGTITGSATTRGVNVNPAGHLDYFEVSLPDGQVLHGRCIDYGLPVPADSTYGFVATPNGDGTYTVVLDSKTGFDYFGAPSGPGIGYNQRVQVDTWSPVIVVRGSLEIDKASAQSAITEGNACYSLAGAVFGVFDEDGNQVLSMRTDANGKAYADELAIGRYVVRELTAPLGYKAAEDQEIDIAAGKTTRVAFEEEAAYALVDVLVEKVDADTGEHVPQGDASLAGARYEVRYYASTATTAEELANATPTRTWVVETDSAGKASLSEQGKVSGDELYVVDGKVVLPLGWVRIQEVSAPHGYAIDETVFWRHVGTDVEQVHGIAPALSEEKAALGGIEVLKVDLETGRGQAQGGATLVGTTFAITNASANPVMVNGSVYAPGQVVMTVVTDEEGLASTGTVLPYGTYEVREAKAPAGYLIGDGKAKTVVVDNSETPARCAEAFENQSIRGDLRFVKVESPSMRHVGGVAFLITSSSTGERHVVVTDENGCFDSAASWNAHAARTNANDVALAADGSVDDSALDAGAGVWFTGYREEENDPDDALGALPFDTYDVRELRCAANEGLGLVSFRVVVTRHGATIDAGTISDEGVLIMTSAADGLDGDRSVVASPQTRVIDTVSYQGLVPGNTYRVEGTLVNAESGEPITDAQGSAVQSSVTFSPRSSIGQVDVTFSFDASGMGTGTRLVVFERLLDQDGSLVARHEDLRDEYQTIVLATPLTVSTQARGQASGTSEAMASANTTLVDTVAYDGTEVGKTYSVVATLMDSQTGEALSDAEGRPVTSTRTFVAEQPGGTMEMSVELDASELGGRDVVFFERIEDMSGNVLASHEDIANREQTVRIIGIGTSLASADDPNAHFLHSAETTRLVDTVTYEGLEPGGTYTVVGRLVNQSDGSDVLDSSGSPVTSQVDFSPTSANGSVAVPFEIDSRQLAGRTVVAFESLVHDGVEVATHADLSDMNQSVSFDEPWIGTVLTGRDSAGRQAHEVIATAAVELVDTVGYRGIEPGSEYLLVGTLMDKATGSMVTDSTGRVVTADARFTPQADSGVASVTFRFDANALAGHEVVAFERLLDASGTVICTHEDLADLGQTVRIVKPEEPDVPSEPSEPGEPSKPDQPYSPVPGEPRMPRRLMQTGVGPVAAVCAAVAIIGLVALATYLALRDVRHGKHWAS